MLFREKKNFKVSARILILPDAINFRSAGRMKDTSFSVNELIRRREERLLVAGLLPDLSNETLGADIQKATANHRYNYFKTPRRLKR